jgi:hypothetical protein
MLDQFVSEDWTRSPALYGIGFRKRWPVKK